MKTIIQKSLVKIAAWYFLVLKKIPELKFSIRNISIHLTSTTILWSGIVTICVIPLFIVLSLSLVIEGGISGKSPENTQQVAESLTSTGAPTQVITRGSTRIVESRIRELPERNLGGSQVKMIGLLPIHSFGANPLMLLTYESTDSGYFSKKSKELTYFLPGERQEFLAQYIGELKTAGWEIQEKPPVQGVNTSTVQPSILYVRKNGSIFGIHIFEDMLKSVEGKSVLKVSIINWIDQNIVFRKQPKMEVLDIPPLPKREITLEASVGYIEQTNGSLTKVGDTYHFVMDTLPESAASTIVKKLEESGYAVSGGKVSQGVATAPIPAPTLSAIPTSPSVPDGGTSEIPMSKMPGVPVELASAPVIPFLKTQEFIPFSSQTEAIQTHPTSIVNHPKWQYFVSKDGQYFELGFSQNIPGKLEPLDGKTLITLRTNVNRFQEGIEYFKTNTNSYSYSGVTTLANKEVYVSYESAKTSDQSSPLTDGTYLPDPVIFSINNKADFVEGVKNDYTKLGYTVSENTLDDKKLQLIITHVFSQYRITIFDRIPNEYQSLIKTGFLVEIVPSLVIPQQ